MSGDPWPCLSLQPIFSGQTPMRVGTLETAAESASTAIRGDGATLLQHTATRQDHPRTGQGGQGQDTATGQSGTGIRRQRRRGRHIGDLSAHREHVPGTLCAAVHRSQWGATRLSPSAPRRSMGGRR